jgi:hypothetical protein
VHGHGETLRSLVWASRHSLISGRAEFLIHATRTRVESSLPAICRSSAVEPVLPGWWTSQPYVQKPWARTGSSSASANTRADMRCYHPPPRRQSQFCASVHRITTARVPRRSHRGLPSHSDSAAWHHRVECLPSASQLESVQSHVFVACRPGKVLQSGAKPTNTVIDTSSILNSSEAAAGRSSAALGSFAGLNRFPG